VLGPSSQAGPTMLMLMLTAELLVGRRKLIGDSQYRLVAVNAESVRFSTERKGRRRLDRTGLDSTRERLLEECDRWGGVDVDV